MRYINIPCLFLPWLLGASPAGGIDWPSDLNSALVANKSDAGSIKSLLNEVLAPDVIPLVRLGGFRFVPLEIPNRVDLIASVALSGRGGLNAFVAVWRTSNGYGHAILPCDVQTVLARDAIDLDGNGVYEVVAGSIPGGRQGRDTLPMAWYGVYGLRAGKWANVSESYPQVNPDPNLNAVLQLAEACEAGSKDVVELYKDNDLYVRFKYNRTMLHMKEAGLDAALLWAKSSNPSIQVLAVETLCEIPGPRATPVLKKLAAGPDAGVRILAEGALTDPGHCSP